MNKYKILFALFLQFAHCTTSFAQRERLDSLDRILPLLKDSARVDCMALLAREYYRRQANELFYKRGYDSALYYYEIISAESRRINYIHGIAESFLIKGSVIYFRDHNLPETERLAREALKWFAICANKKRIEDAYFQLGAMLLYENRDEEAYTYLEQCDVWALMNGTKRFGGAIEYMYEYYRDNGDYDKAFAVFQRLQQHNLAQKGNVDTTAEYYVMAELSKQIEDYPTALKYYGLLVHKEGFKNFSFWKKISYAELLALNGIFDSARYYYNLIDTSNMPRYDFGVYLISVGELFLLKKEYKQAIGNFLRGLMYERITNDKTKVKRALLDIARTYLGLMEYTHALVYAREELDIALRTQAKQFIRDGYKVLYIVYQQRNESDSAFTYYKKYIAQKEIVASDVMRGKFASYKYDQIIFQLSKDRQMQQQQIQQTTLQKKFLVIGMAVLFILGVVIFRNILLKRKSEAGLRKIAESELQIHKLHATELEMQALRAQMNPHFIFNCLSSINRFILLNETEKASDYLTKFSRLVRMVLNNSSMQTILLEDELEMLRLYLDLERLRFKNTFDYRIVFHNNLDASSIYIPPLLLQPFAENAIWHGLMHKEGNRLLEIAFSIEGDFLNCLIADNGVGRANAESLKSKSAEKQKSMGIQITSKRLTLLNKNMEQPCFEIKDLVDELGEILGTRVILKIRYKESVASLS